MTGNQSSSSYANNPQIMYGTHIAVLDSKELTYENPIGRFIIPYATSSSDPNQQDKTVTSTSTVDGVVNNNSYTHSTQLYLTVPRHLFYITQSEIQTNKSPCPCALQHGFKGGIESPTSEAEKSITTEMTESSRGAACGLNNPTEYSIQQAADAGYNQQQSDVNDSGNEAKDVTQAGGETGGAKSMEEQEPSSAATESATTGMATIYTSNAQQYVEYNGNKYEVSDQITTLGSTALQQDQDSSKEYFVDENGNIYEIGEVTGLAGSDTIIAQLEEAKKRAEAEKLRIAEEKAAIQQSANSIRSIFTQVTNAANIASKASNLIQSMSGKNVNKNLFDDIKTKVTELANACVETAKSAALAILTKTATAFAETLWKVGLSAAWAAAISAAKSAGLESIQASGKKALEKVNEVVSALPFYNVATKADQLAKANTDALTIAIDVAKEVSSTLGGSSSTSTNRSDLENITRTFTSMTQALEKVTDTGETLALKAVANGLRVQDILSAAGGTASEIAQAFGRATNTTINLSTVMSATSSVASLMNIVSSSQESAIATGANKSVISMAFQTAYDITKSIGDKEASTLLELASTVTNIAIDAGNTSDVITSLAKTKYVQNLIEDNANTIVKQILKEATSSWKDQANKIVISTADVISQLSTASQQIITSGKCMARAGIENNAEAGEIVEEVEKKLDSMCEPYSFEYNEIYYIKANTFGYIYEEVASKTSTSSTEIENYVYNNLYAKLPVIAGVIPDPISTESSDESESTTSVAADDLETYLAPYRLSAKHATWIQEVEERIKILATVVGWSITNASHLNASTTLTDSANLGTTAATNTVTKIANDIRGPVTPTTTNTTPWYSSWIQIDEEQVKEDATKEHTKNVAAHDTAAATRAGEAATTEADIQAQPTGEKAEKKVNHTVYNQPFIGVGTCNPKIINIYNVYRKGQKFIGVHLGGDTRNFNIIGVVQEL